MAETAVKTNPVPPEVLERVGRAERAMRGLEPSWQEALAFFSNDQYVEQSAITGQLDRLETREGGSKPRHRPRLQRNRMTSKVMREVSLLTSRVPGFGVDPPNGDPSADNQAQLSEKVLDFQITNMRMVDMAIDALVLAICTGGAGVMPFWNFNKGEYLGLDDEDALYTGDVDRFVMHQGELLWEVGVPFEDSEWVCVRKAQAVSKLRGEAEFNKDNIVADAKQGVWERPGTEKGELAFRYEYFEKPCRGKKGKWLRYVDNFQIRKELPYPRKNGKPVIHFLRWFPQPHRHRPLGAGELLVECQRSRNRTVNQITAIKNHVHMPQILAPEGSIIGKVTDEAGAVIQYRPVSGLKPEWRPMPEIPTTLFETLDRIDADMDDILGGHELPTGVESGSGIEKANEREQNYRALFIRQLAEWWSGLGQHTLELTQEGYTEKRLIPVNGRFMPDRIPDFLGRDLGELGTVRVTPREITPRSRGEQEARIQYYADRQWIPPHEAIKALDAGTVEAIVTEIELDESKQDREIRRLTTLAARLGEPTDDPEVLNMINLEDAGKVEVPSEEFPMPGPYDNHAVHMDILKKWFKTRDFETQPLLVQMWGMDHFKAHELAVMAEEMQAAQQQAIQAQQLGTSNAARPPSTGQPSQPKEQAMLEAGAGSGPPE